MAYMTEKKTNISKLWALELKSIFNKPFWIENLVYDDGWIFFLYIFFYFVKTERTEKKQMQQLKSSIVIRSGVIKQMHELSSQLNITSTASNGALCFLSGNSTEGADCLPCRSLPHMLPRMRIWDTACNSTDAAR